jgi:hypothetical protein
MTASAPLSALPRLDQLDALADQHEALISDQDAVVSTSADPGARREHGADNRTLV